MKILGFKGIFSIFKNCNFSKTKKICETWEILEYDCVHACDPGAICSPNYALSDLVVFYVKVLQVLLG